MLTTATAYSWVKSFSESCTANQCCEGPLLASSESSVAHVTGNAMADHQQHGEGSTASSVPISTTEPMAMIIDIETSKYFYKSCCIYANMILSLLPASQWFIVNILWQTLGRSASGFSVSTFALRLLMMLRKHSFLTCSCCTLVLKHSII